MNQKKVLLGALGLCTAGMLLFSACKKKDPENNSIIGKWEAVSSSYVYDNTSVTPPIHEKKDTTFATGKALVIEFRTNNSYTTTDYSTTPNEVNDGTFSEVNGKLIIKESSSSTPDTVSYSVTGGNKLVISSSYSAAGESSQFSETFTRR